MMVENNFQKSFDQLKARYINEKRNYDVFNLRGHSVQPGYVSFPSQFSYHYQQTQQSALDQHITYSQLGHSSNNSGKNTCLYPTEPCKCHIHPGNPCKQPNIFSQPNAESHPEQSNQQLHQTYSNQNGNHYKYSQPSYPAMTNIPGRLEQLSYPYPQHGYPKQYEYPVNNRQPNNPEKSRLNQSIKNASISPNEKSITSYQPSQSCLNNQPTYSSQRNYGCRPVQPSYKYPQQSNSNHHGYSDQLIKPNHANQGSNSIAPRQNSSSNKRSQHTSLQPDKPISHDIIHPYQCDICHALFATEEFMTRHRRSHSNTGHDRRHKCPHCPYSTSDSTHISYHLLTHTNERPHRCPLCPLTFQLDAHLRSHLRSSHGEEKPFKCSYCVKKFSYGKCLSKHERSHLAPAKWVCTTCKKIYRRKHSLEKHELTHTKIKPHKPALRVQDVI